MNILEEPDIKIFLGDTDSIVKAIQEPIGPGDFYLRIETDGLRDPLASLENPQISIRQSHNWESEGINTDWEFKIKQSSWHPNQLKISKKSVEENIEYLKKTCSEKYLSYLRFKNSHELHY